MTRSKWLPSLLLIPWIVFSSGARAEPSEPLRSVLLVGNSVSGSVSLIAEDTLTVLGTVNVIPDIADRLNDINNNPIRAVIYWAVNHANILPHFEPDQGHRFVDDVFTSPDGARLYVSRGNLGDVAAFDLTKKGFPMLWRTDISMRADHAALSPDGTRIAVSAVATDEVEILSAQSGGVVGSFGTGLLPHQNDFSADGRHIYNTSLGIPDTTLPCPLDFCRLTIVDATTLETTKSFSFDAGIRPNVFTPDESTFYAQLSNYNGLIKFDLNEGRTVARLKEPLSDFATANYPDAADYPHNSAHHGLALSKDGLRLCDVGTIDNTVSIVTTADLKVESVTDVGMIPYWATTSSDGQNCYVSLSGDNAISVINYAGGKEVARVPVGKFPQRTRLGKVRASSLAVQ